MCNTVNSLYSTSSLSSPSSWFSGWRSSITAPTRRVTSLAHPPPRDPHRPCRGPKLRQIPGVMHRSRRLPPPPRHRSRADERSCMTVPERRSSRFGVRVFFEEVEQEGGHSSVRSATRNNQNAWMTATQSTTTWSAFAPRTAAIGIARSNVTNRPPCFTASARR